MDRNPYVAGYFYPAAASELKTMIARFTATRRLSVFRARDRSHRLQNKIQRYVYHHGTDPQRPGQTVQCDG